MRTGQSDSATFLIVGGGAVGAYYGWRLSGAGHKVCVVCRSNYSIVRERGFIICSQGKEYSFIPHVVLNANEEMQELPIPAFLFITTKAVTNDEVLRYISRRPEAHSPVCVAQNGVDVEKPFVTALPERNIISVVPYVAVSQTSPGVVMHYAFGDLAIGSIPGGRNEQVERLASILSKCGVRCTIAEDIRAVRWQKAVWNVAFNSASALAGGIGVRRLLEHPSGQRLLKGLMLEVMNVASADGYPLPPDYVDFALETTAGMPDYVPSTGLDRIRGKAMEIEVLIGNVLRLARKYKQDTPRLETAMDIFSSMPPEINPLCSFERRAHLRDAKTLGSCE
jgi:2-dehydropantoate 2-reductase